MFRRFSLWICFAACLAVVLAAMGWISMTAVRSDRAEREARRQTAMEQKVRLALWRMDTALAPLLAEEAHGRISSISSFFPANRSFNRMFNAQTEAGSLIPSPLLQQSPWKR